MKTNFYKITLACLIMSIGMLTFAQDQLMYVTHEAEYPGDSILIEYLELEGEYTVTVVLRNDFKAAPYDEASAYADFDVIYISEYVGSSDVKNFAAAEFPIPCVFTEGYAVRSDKWGWLEDNATQFNQLSSADGITLDVCKMVMTGADHWITDQYDTDYELLWCQETVDLSQMGVTGCMLDEIIPEAIELANFTVDSMKGFPCMWAIPEGSEVTGLANDVVTDFVLPNMVYIGSIGEGMNVPTEEFLELILTSIKWVTDDYELAISSVQQNDLNAYPNPTNGIVNVSVTYPVSGNVMISVYDMAGKVVKTQNYVASSTTSFSLDLSDITSGQYIYKLNAENEAFSGKITKN